MITVYGIKNCDTVKKALRWLEKKGIECRLHDYRTDGLDPAFLHRAAERFGWQALVNKRGTTWRNLNDESKKTLNFDTALSLMSEHPTLIKRPIILQDGIALIGFNEEEYGKTFA